MTSPQRDVSAETSGSQTSRPLLDLGHLLSPLAWRATRVEWSPWKNLLIDFVVRRYRVDLEEALEPDPRAYPSFNAFFTRALKHGARPVDPRPDALLSPADGALYQVGRVERGTLLQAKGIDYPVEALLGGDRERAAQFADAAYLTVYLSPRDYHRVHMPLSGTLREMIYVPGRLLSVQPRVVERVPGVFAANERVVSIFDGPAGPFAVVLVGATMVGGVSQIWCGAVMPPRANESRVWRYAPGEVTLERGAEMGRFEMGSTVIVLVPRAGLRWEDGIAPGAAVKVGRAVATISAAAGS